jgi:hypothetical protein
MIQILLVEKSGIQPDDDRYRGIIAGPDQLTMPRIIFSTSRP